MEIALVLAALGIWSVWIRSRRYRQSAQMKTKVSPLSMALQELIAVAGGIYLSLILLVSFLKVSIPEKIFLWGVDLEPLALISVVLAALQPLAEKIIRWVK